MLPDTSATRNTDTSVLDSELLGWREPPGSSQREGGPADVNRRSGPAAVNGRSGRMDALMSGDALDSARLAADITRAASKQTYYTIKCLVDRDRVAHAYRAYAYFRWIDDNLDVAIQGDGARLAFLKRQQSIVERCVRGLQPGSLSPEEQMLVHLLADRPGDDSGLLRYVRDMMAVMSFDAGRRGRLITESDLAEYERLLATAVTEALHHFIGHDRYSPRDDSRYLAATGAHIAHMLRDSHDDLAAGYPNVPRELLDDYHIGPADFGRKAYRDWVRTRVVAARECFDSGREYLRRVDDPRCRLAGHCYIARFEGVLDAIEKDGYLLRPDYSDVGRRCAVAQAGWAALCSALQRRRPSRARTG